MALSQCFAHAPSLQMIQCYHVHPYIETCRTGCETQLRRLAKALTDSMLKQLQGSYSQYQLASCALATAGHTMHFAHQVCRGGWLVAGVLAIPLFGSNKSSTQSALMFIYRHCVFTTEKAWPQPCNLEEAEGLVQFAHR